MVNRGEEKVRVHMNVVPRSTGNTNRYPRYPSISPKQWENVKVFILKLYLIV